MSALEMDPGRNGHRTQPGRTPIHLVPTLASVAAGPVGPHDLSARADVFDFSTICAEEVHVPERLIAAPTAGVFQAAPPEVVTAEGEIVHAGQVVGSIQLTDGCVSVTSISFWLSRALPHSQGGAPITKQPAGILHQPSVQSGLTGGCSQPVASIGGSSQAGAPAWPFPSPPVDLPPEAGLPPVACEVPPPLAAEPPVSIAPPLW